MTSSKLQKAWFAELYRAAESWRRTFLDQIFRPDPERDRLHEPDLRKAIAKLRAAAPALDEAALSHVLDDCLMGLLHSVHVAVDGGSELADTGLVQLVDERGTSLGDGLHELFPIYVDAQRSSKRKRKTPARAKRR